MPGITMKPLEAEYLAAFRGTRSADLAPLREAGVGGTGLAVGAAWAGIQLHGDRFEFDPDGDGFAFVIPVRADNPITPETVADPQQITREAPVIDLVAFSAGNGRCA